MVVLKGKFTRQSVSPQETDILRAIDQRFKQLEETQQALASQVPELHDRVHALEQLEQKFKRRRQTAKGSKSGDVMPGPPKVKKQEPVVSDGESDIANVVKVEEVVLAPPRAMQTLTDLSRSMVMEMDEKILDTQTEEYYTFGESTWDLVIFIGTGALGPLGGFQTFLLAMVSVLMQIIFVAIALYNFTVPDIDENSVRDALRWRRSTGHSFSGYSDVAKESLVHRVCKLDKSLDSSGIQVDLLENINKYLKSDAAGLEGVFTGQILCMVALICWYLMVAKEVSHALALHRGVTARPTGPTMLDTRENPFTQATHYRLRTVATKRKIFSTYILLYRLLAAGLLVFVGTFFLVYTVPWLVD